MLRMSIGDPLRMTALRDGSATMVIRGVVGVVGAGVGLGKPPGLPPKPPGPPPPKPPPNAPRPPGPNMKPPGLLLRLLFWRGPLYISSSIRATSEALAFFRRTNSKF